MFVVNLIAKYIKLIDILKVFFLNTALPILQEKKALREEKLQQEEKYMWAIVDGVKEKVWFCLTLAFSIVLLSNMVL